MNLSLARTAQQKLFTIFISVKGEKITYATLISLRYNRIMCVAWIINKLLNLKFTWVEMFFRILDSFSSPVVWPPAMLSSCVLRRNHGGFRRLSFRALTPRATPIRDLFWLPGRSQDKQYAVWTVECSVSNLGYPVLGSCPMNQGLRRWNCLPRICSVVANPSILRHCRWSSAWRGWNICDQYFWTKMVLPFVKLGSLALKTLSKPLAAAVKRRAASHPQFREFIINMAQVSSFYR